MYVIPVQWYTNWATKPSGSLLCCCNRPVFFEALVLEMLITVIWSFTRSLMIMICIYFTRRYPDTPCISQTLSVTFSDSHTQSVLDAVSSIGDVSMTGSLQIAELVEHPGAILVQWFDEVMFLCIHLRIQERWMFDLWQGSMCCVLGCDS